MPGMPVTPTMLHIPAGEFLMGSDAFYSDEGPAHRVRVPAFELDERPVTNAEFTATLGRVLSRPTIFPMPAFAARLAFGEMADALLLSSTRVAPQVLAGAGYNFHDPRLEPALRRMLGRA